MIEFRSDEKIEVGDRLRVIEADDVSAQDQRWIGECVKTIKSAYVRVYHAGRLLLIQRAFDDRWVPGKWDLPGGKVGEGETPHDTAIRELKEKIGIVAIALQLERRVYRGPDLVDTRVFSIELDERPRLYVPHGWFVELPDNLAPDVKEMV